MLIQPNLVNSKFKRPANQFELSLIYTIKRYLNTIFLTFITIITFIIHTASCIIIYYLKKVLCNFCLTIFHNMCGELFNFI